jgi:hypothetical protein
MIQKFGGVIHPAYQFTTTFADLAEKLLKNIQPLSVDWKKEPFVAACWIHNFLSSGKIFVLITSQRVVYKDPLRVTQNLFADMTGVERNRLTRNIQLLSPGNPNKLFANNTIPGDDLVTVLFDLINATWNKTRQNAPAGQATAPALSTHDSAPVPPITAQIEQLGALRDKGILTEEEFQQKKKELLTRM